MTPTSRDTAPRQAADGWYDDDLLYAVVPRGPQRAVETLVDLSRHVRGEADAWKAMRSR
ncbi:hypothetical protein SMCF_4144 [Streptomyces coelicoflavus ZG0656]|nr:hypothetical protein SMCF_4144 [Streptomyces coelicoflavus ZG0656]MZE48399.1 hypothetical protein [Streptomyces sp. SID5477]